LYFRVVPDAVSKVLSVSWARDWAGAGALEGMVEGSDVGRTAGASGAGREVLGFLEVVGFEEVHLYFVVMRVWD
jgi:hypothetical protein